MRCRLGLVRRLSLAIVPLGALILLAALAGAPLGRALAAEAGPQPAIEVFVREGCAHCEAARDFLAELVREQPGLQISFHDVRQHPDALARLNELSQRAGSTRPGVPTILIGSELIVGFDTPAGTGAQIRAALNRAAVRGQAAVCGVADETACPAAGGPAIELPFGDRQLRVADIGLPLFAIVIGLLDGFNPCSMWVLVLMLSMLATLGDRRRMLVLAGTFVVIQGVAYFGFMAAWLNLFLLVGWSRISEIAIALLALVAGAINLKDFVAFGKGISLSIPAAAKPGIYARLRAILRAGPLWPAVAGAAVLAVLVQVVELLCTSGFPALYTRILTLQGLDRASYYGYLLLYNLMYVLDDIIVLGIGVATLSQRRLQEKERRILKLVAGLVMVGLGVYLLVPH